MVNDFEVINVTVGEWMAQNTEDVIDSIHMHKEMGRVQKLLLEEELHSLVDFVENNRKQIQQEAWEYIHHFNRWFLGGADSICIGVVI
jgi:hypothetical protein